MKRYFPSTPLYPTLGNHEAHPVNTYEIEWPVWYIALKFLTLDNKKKIRFSPPEIQNLGDLSISWLYEDADVQWSRWLPAEVSSTVRYGGYYTTLVRPGLRIVSMNNNYCYTANWWTMLRSQDPASGLLWLSQVLESAERDGEKVRLILFKTDTLKFCYFDSDSAFCNRFIFWVTFRQEILIAGPSLVGNSTSLSIDLNRLSRLNFTVTPTTKSTKSFTMIRGGL